MAVRTPFEIRALELVTESAQHGGFWGLIADDTLNIIVQAVALDLQRAAQRAEVSRLGSATDSANVPERARSAK